MWAVNEQKATICVSTCHCQGDAGVSCGTGIGFSQCVCVWGRLTGQSSDSVSVETIRSATLILSSVCCWWHFTGSLIISLSHTHTHQNTTDGWSVVGYRKKGDVTVGLPFTPPTPKIIPTVKVNNNFWITKVSNLHTVSFRQPQAANAFRSSLVRRYVRLVIE